MKAMYRIRPMYDIVHMLYLSVETKHAVRSFDANYCPMIIQMSAAVIMYDGMARTDRCIYL